VERKYFLTKRGIGRGGASFFEGNCSEEEVRGVNSLLVD